MRQRLKLFFMASPLPLLLIAAVFLIASASSKASLSCTMALQVIAPGQESAQGTGLEVIGQQVAGTVQCEDGQAVLSGPIVIEQDAWVIVDPATGEFMGDISGTFDLNGSSGWLGGSVTGRIGEDGVVVSETITGKWQLDDRAGPLDAGSDVLRGTFHITLTPHALREAPVTGELVLVGGERLPTLAGLGSLYAERR